MKIKKYLKLVATIFFGIGNMLGGGLLQAQGQQLMVSSKNLNTQVLLNQLKFEKNMGQWVDTNMVYRTTDQQATHYFQPHEIRTVITNADNEQQLAYAMKFIEPSDKVKLKGVGVNRSMNHYIYPQGTFSDVPQYQRLHYDQLWKGVSMWLHGNEGKLKYDFVVAPKADPSIVQFRLDGAKDLKINKKGELEFTTAFGVLQKGRPLTYQVVNGQKKIIPSAYELRGDTVGFKIGAYDTTNQLIIDPIALLWSTFLGSSGITFLDMALHPTTGNIYLLGVTSNATYPTTIGQPFGGGSIDGIIMCVSKDGTSVLWSTFIGGSGTDYMSAIEIGTDGDIFIVGRTTSADYPVNGTVAAYDDSYNGNYDLIISRLSPDGTTLKYGTFIGTTSPDGDNNRNMVLQGDKVFFTSYGYSDDFPTTPNAYQATRNGIFCVVYGCINTAVGGFAGLEYATYFRPNTTGFVYPTDIASDGAGNIYITGFTSSLSDFTFTPDAVQNHTDILATSGAGSIYTSYVAKFSPTGDLLYLTAIAPVIRTDGISFYNQYSSHITVDDVGNIYHLDGWNIPNVADLDDIEYTSNANQINQINPLGFIYTDDLYFKTLVKIPAANPSQYEFVNIFSGQGFFTTGGTITLDQKDRIHVIYHTNSQIVEGMGMTTTNGALQTSTPIGDNNTWGMYQIYQPTGNLSYSTVLGPSYATNSSVIPYGLVVSEDCNAYITGTINNQAYNFPTTPSYHDFSTGSQKTIYQTTPDNPSDGFLMVFHEPEPINAINDFAVGNNTFCEGSLIYQNPDEGPIIGQTAGYTSGDGSTSTHNLPDISRNGTITAHPTPSLSGYQWQKSYDGVVWADIPGANLEVLKPTSEPTAGTVQYRRAIIGGCDTINYSNVATATISGSFNLAISVPNNPTYFCPGTAEDLGIVITGASGNISWQWYDGFAPLSSDVITPTNGTATMATFTASIATTATRSGFYRLVVTDAGGCKREAFVSIASLTAPAGTGPTMTICPNSVTNNVTIGPSAVNPNFDYQWTGPSGFTANVPNPIVTNAGDYYLQVKLKSQATYCATGETTVNVPTFNPHHVGLIDLPDVAFCQADNPGHIGNGSVGTPPGYVFQWSPGVNLNDATLFNPKFDPGVLPYGAYPVSSVEYTFTALRLSDGCIFETKFTVTDTARAFAQAGIDKVACSTLMTQNFGSASSSGTYFEWRPIATTYPSGLSSLTTHADWSMDGAATTLATNKFLNVTFPLHTGNYTVDLELIASNNADMSGCITKDTARLFYTPTCGDWCTDIASNATGSQGVCSGETTYIQGASLGGLTHTWTTHSVDGVVQPGNTPPKGLFLLENGIKSNPIDSFGAHPNKVIADIDDATWGWPGANVVIYRLISAGNFGEGWIDCHKDVQVFSATNALPTVEVSDKSLCNIVTPGTRFGTAGEVPPYKWTSADYNTAPNTGLFWEWGAVGSNSVSTIADYKTLYPTFNPSVSTRYWVKVQDPVTGCFAYDTMRIKMVQVVANAGSDISNICEGSLVQLGTSSLNNHTYAWSPSGGLNFPIGTPNHTTAQPFLTAPSASSGITYTITATETTTGCQATDEVIITTSTIAPNTPAAASYYGCGGSSFTMGGTVSGVGVTFNWSAGAGGDLSWLSATDINRPIVNLPNNFTGPATFILTATKGSCGSSSQSYTISNGAISLNLGSSVTATCSTPYVKIGTSAVSNYIYSWVPHTGLYEDANGTIPYTGSNLSEVYALPTQTTTYTLTASNNTGCTISETITVNAPTGVIANAGVDKTWCSGTAAISVGTSGQGTLTWSAVGYNSNPNGTPTTPTVSEAATMMTYLSSSSTVPTSFSQLTSSVGKFVYRLTAVDGSCSVFDEVTVTVPAFQNDLAGLPQSVCAGESLQLGSATAPVTYHYTWTALNPITANTTIDNPSVAQPLVTPTTTTTYQVTYVDGTTGCSASDIVGVSITPAPTIADVSTNPFCAPISNQNLTFFIPDYGNYFNPIWYKDALGSTIITDPTDVAISQATNYFLVVENTYGCKDTAQLVFNVETTQTPIVPTSEYTLCPDNTLDISQFQGVPSQIGNSLEWHNSSTPNASTLLANTIVPPGTYYLFEQSPNACYSNGAAIIVISRGCEEVCDNEADDDGDGLIDCADPDCILEVPSGIQKN